MLAIENSNAQPTKDETENNMAMLECLRDSASNVYDEFLCDAVSEFLMNNVIFGGRGGLVCRTKTHFSADFRLYIE